VKGGGPSFLFSWEGRKGSRGRGGGGKVKKGAYYYVKRGGGGGKKGGGGGKRGKGIGRGGGGGRGSFPRRSGRRWREGRGEGKKILRKEEEDDPSSTA